MVTIIHGPAARLGTTVLAAARRREDAIVLVNAASDFVPWAGARTLLAALQQRVPPATVDAALAPHRVLLSLTLPWLAAQLTTAERVERGRLGGLRRGLVPHTRLTQRHLARAWTDVLARLAPEARCALALTDIACLDAESRPLVRMVAARCGADVEFIVGHAPGARPSDRLAELAHESAKQEVELLSLAGAVTVEIVETDADQRSAPGPASDDSARDGERDHGAWRELHHAGASSDEGTLRDGALQRLDDAFDAHGFDAVLHLASAFVARWPADPGCARAHLLGALAANSARIPWLSPRSREIYLELEAEHLEAALACGQEPEQVAHLLYRQSLLEGRERGNPQAGRELARQAIEIARSHQIAAGRASFFEAWARNAEAYSLFRLRRADEALATGRTAVELLTEAATTVDAEEVTVSRMLVLGNLARLETARGAWVRASALQRESFALEDAVPADRVPRLPWAHLAHFDLGRTVNILRRRLEESREEGNLRTECTWTQLLAEACFRQGDAAAAHAWFTTTLENQMRIGDPDADLTTARLNIAVSSFRAGWLVESEERFTALLAGPLGDDDAARAELVGATAWIAGAAGEHSVASERVERALQLAHSVGDPGVRARVLRSAAEVALLAAQVSRCRFFVEQGLALVAAEAGAGPSALDEFGLLAVAAASGDFDPERARRVLLLVPSCLADVNSWWDLGRLLQALTEVGAQGRVVPSDELLRESWHRLLEAARQRKDCADFVARATGMLERQHDASRLRRGA